MSSLVDYDEQRAFLDLPYGTDEEVIETLLDEATKLFEMECGRAAAPFAVAQTGRIEIHQASSASVVLSLDYPIATVTSIASGLDVALPDETLLSPISPSVVAWQVGKRDLVRVDGGVWRRSAPRWVKVVYNTQDDLPGDVKLAVKRVVATIYQGRGERAISGSRGSRSWSVTDTAATEDPFWQSALRNHQRAWFR